MKSQNLYQQSPVRKVNFEEIVPHCVLKCSFPLTQACCFLLICSRIPSKYVHKDGTLLVSMKRIGAV